MRFAGTCQRRLSKPSRYPKRDRVGLADLISDRGIVTLNRVAWTAQGCYSPRSDEVLREETTALGAARRLIVNRKERRLSECCPLQTHLCKRLK
jgi:hypothetical protein